MRPVKVPPAGVGELRAAVRAFADQPGPARFHRVVRLLERVEAKQGKGKDRPDRDLPY